MSEENDHVAETKSPFLSSVTYDSIRKVQQQVLPALGAFYAALALIWGLPYSTQVIGTLAAIATVFGVLLSLSKKSFQENGGDGTIDPETGLISLNVQSVVDKDTIVLTKGPKAS